MTDIDEATGLPELPECYFWRIRHSVGEWWVVEIMRRRRFRPAKREEYGVFSKYKACRKEVMSTALFAYRQWEKLGHRDEFLKNIKGDYPPKRLEN